MFHNKKLVVIFTALIIQVTSQKNPYFFDNHVAIVNLFEWKFKDIARECKDYLGPKGFGGVQVGPIQENVVLEGRPWFERYQPVSYEIQTRSGNEADFVKMVKVCTNAKVRVYVEVVLRHMTGDSELTETDIEDVQEITVKFLNKLIGFGVAGFYVNSASHIFPNDLQKIYEQLTHLNKNYGFPDKSKPFIMQEVMVKEGASPSKFEYNRLGRVTEYLYPLEVSAAFQGTKTLHSLLGIGPKKGYLPSEDAVVLLLTPSHQRRKENPNEIHKKRVQYEMALAFMLAHPYGIVHLFSSYAFNELDQGPPSDSDENIISPKFDVNQQCVNGWICEHRWPVVEKMIKFRNEVGDGKLNNWADNGLNQIAFCRGKKGFIAFHNEKNGNFNTTIPVCLPEGIYQNIFTSTEENALIDVTEESKANIFISSADKYRMVGFHADSIVLDEEESELAEIVVETLDDGKKNCDKR